MQSSLNEMREYLFHATTTKDLVNIYLHHPYQQLVPELAVRLIR